jgi:hypothetical protein
MGNYLDIILVISDLAEFGTLTFEIQQYENKIHKPPSYH